MHSFSCSIHWSRSFSVVLSSMMGRRTAPLLGLSSWLLPLSLLLLLLMFIGGCGSAADDSRYAKHTHTAIDVQIQFTRPTVCVLCERVAGKRLCNARGGRCGGGGCGENGKSRCLLPCVCGCVCLHGSFLSTGHFSSRQTSVDTARTRQLLCTVAAQSHQLPADRLFGGFNRVLE